MVANQRIEETRSAASESTHDARKQFLHKLASDLEELGKHDLAVQTRQRTEQLKTPLTVDEWMVILDNEWRLYMGFTKPQ